MRTLFEDIKSKCLHVHSEINYKTILKTLFMNGTSAMVLYRISAALQKWHLGIIGQIVTKFNYHWNSIVIGQGAKFGNGFAILHSLGVVINGATVAGENIYIESCVTIGSDKNKVPILGNNIYIGTGAKILGGIKIGDNVKIGANAVVIKDIPSNCTAVGVPAKIITQ